MLQIPKGTKNPKRGKRGTVIKPSRPRLSRYDRWQLGESLPNPCAWWDRPHFDVRCSQCKLVSNWYRKKILHDTNFHNSCHLKKLAVQIEALHCIYPKIRYAHKPFCSLCRIQRRHWTHTCYSRKWQKVASAISQLDFFKTVLFCGDCCNRHSVHCANYSK